MTLYDYRPVANGIRTDHPIPGLPFVDDMLLPLDDPAGIEAIGRVHGTDTWGREDRCGDAGWTAFTTDPIRHDLAWCVRWHPEHGRSVILYRDDDISGVHMAYWGPALLFRAGAYWWDGSTWYRPSQIWDRASEEYIGRLVPAAATVTAASLLADASDPARGQVLTITDVPADGEPPSGYWPDNLAMWAARHDGLALDKCVVSLTAPELNGDQLVGITDMARIGDVAASTLRSYIARGEASVPLPQAVVSGRPVWARPVAEEWAEQRRRSSDGVAAAVSGGRPGDLDDPPGVTEIRQSLTRRFFSILWERPDTRRRWALRWRTAAAVRDVAEHLAWEAAVTLPRVIRADSLGITISHAILDEFATAKESDERSGNTDPVFYGITHHIARMLGWLVRYDPVVAAAVVGETVGDAERRMNIPRKVAEQSIRTALALDSDLDTARIEEFLDRVLTPSSDLRQSRAATLSAFRAASRLRR